MNQGEREWPRALLVLMGRRRAVWNRERREPSWQECQRIAAILRRELAGGERLSNEVWGAVEKSEGAEFSRVALWRAKSELGVVEFEARNLYWWKIKPPKKGAPPDPYLM